MDIGSNISHNIQIKLEVLQHTLNGIVSDIGDIKEAVYDQEKGIYVKIRNADSTIKQIESWTNKHEVADNELREQTKKVIDKLEPLLYDFDQRKKAKTWTDKIWSTILIFLIGAVLVPLWKVVIEPTNKSSSGSSNSLKKAQE